MATQEPTPLPNAAEMTPQQIADQIAAETVQQGEPPQLQREYVVQTDTGAVFRGKTQQEVIDAMKKSVEHGSQTIKQQKDELERYKAQLEQQAPYIQQVQQQQQVQAQQFNPNQYYERWAQDPLNAEITLLDYALQQRYGRGLDEVLTQVDRSHRFVDQVEPEVIASTWKANSTFPGWDENHPEEYEKAAQALETVWNEFYPNDLKITPQKLEQVHAVAVMRGMYQPRNSQTGQVQVQGNEQQQPPQNLMPTLNAGSSGGTGQQQEVNQMSPEQIRQLIDQGQFR